MAWYFLCGLGEGFGDNILASIFPYFLKKKDWHGYAEKGGGWAYVRLRRQGDDDKPGGPQKQVVYYRCCLRRYYEVRRTENVINPSYLQSIAGSRRGQPGTT